MAQVKITLVKAPPETLLCTEVTQFACVTENESILNLPMSFSFLRVKRVTVWTFHGDLRLVKLLTLRALLELSTFLPQILNTIMLLLLIVV